MSIAPTLPPQLKPMVIEEYCRGPLFVADTEKARVNKAVLEVHFAAEWQNDIETTMATMDPVNPWQLIPALGVDLSGPEAVRQYYQHRFDNYPGPAMKWFDRVGITDDCAYVEGTLDVTPASDFAGVDVGGAHIVAPMMIVIVFKDGLVFGEMGYVDAATLRAEGGN